MYTLKNYRKLLDKCECLNFSLDGLPNLNLEGLGQNNPKSTIGEREVKNIINKIKETNAKNEIKREEDTSKVLEMLKENELTIKQALFILDELWIINVESPAVPSLEELLNEYTESNQKNSITFSSVNNFNSRFFKNSYYELLEDFKD
jgi:ribosome-interacting GTPase 1